MSYRFLKTVEIKHFKQQSHPILAAPSTATSHQLSHSRDCGDHHAHPQEVACPRDGAVRPSPGPSLARHHLGRHLGLLTASPAHGA